MESSWGVKYRPHTLAEFVGKGSVIPRLASEMEGNCVPHRILLSGPSGTGKTSLAYILAEYFTGRPYDPQVESPCVAELNCAAEGIDTIRAMIERVRYTPLVGKRHVVIVDEVQALTAAGAKALYKPLETESDTVWLLLTNEAYKLDPTLVSRLNRYELTCPSPEELVRLAKEIYDTETLTFSTKLVKQLAERADNVRMFVNALQDASSSGDEDADRLLQKASGETHSLSEGLVNLLRNAGCNGEAYNVMTVYATWADLLCAAVADHYKLNMQMTYFRRAFVEQVRDVDIRSIMNALDGLNAARTSVVTGGCNGVAAFMVNMLMR